MPTETQNLSTNLFEQDETEFKNLISSFDSHSVNLFFQCMEYLAEKLQLRNEVDLVFSTKRSHLSFQVGNRYCFRYQKKGFAFITPADCFINGLEKEEFKNGASLAFAYYHASEKHIRQYLPAITTAIMHELERDVHTQEKDYDNKAFRKAVFERPYRESLFNFQPVDLSFVDQENIPIMSYSFPLNQILYGPPGTGKTYHTIKKAVEIIHPEFYNENTTREEVRQEYDRLRALGLIEFITFHQSMSYEDFIEGIKPLAPDQSHGFLRYGIEDGIFKRIAIRADYVPTPEINRFGISEQEFQQSSFYKISLGDTNIEGDNIIYEYCIQNNVIALGWGEGLDFTGLNESEVSQAVNEKGLKPYTTIAVNALVHYMKEGDYVIVSKGNTSFRAIGLVTGAYEYRTNPEIPYHQFRQVKWLLSNENIPVEEIYNKGFSQQSLYRLSKQEIKKSFFVRPEHTKQTAIKSRNHVLIIDEINRGNIAAIFGELITLIEDDKRKGKAESIELELPYSKKPFSVPDNLYIIGTMNTADRSVEALDTALRRRFVFEEMKPDTSLLSPVEVAKRVWVKNRNLNNDDPDWIKADKELNELLGIEIPDNSKYRQRQPEMPREILESNFSVIQFHGLNLEEMLNAINERLEALLSADHTIGHAWLMGVNSLHSLKLAFRNKILPLLREYFYHDYAKIGLVLGQPFVRTVPVKTSMFSSFPLGQDILDDLDGKQLFSLTDPQELTIEAFKSIYQK